MKQGSIKTGMLLKSQHNWILILLFIALIVPVAEVAAAPGDIVWHETYEESVRGPLAMTSDGDIVARFGNFGIAKFDGDGDLIWSRLLHETLGGGSGPFIDDRGNIYIIVDRLYSLSPDGQILWTYKWPDRINNSPVVVSNGRIFFTERFGSSVTLQVIDDNGMPIHRDTKTNGPSYILGVDADGTLLSTYERYRSDFTPIPGNTQLPGEFLALDGAGGGFFRVGETIVHFDSNDIQLAQFTEIEAVGNIRDLAVDSSGGIYVKSSSDTITGFGGDGALKWNFHLSDSQLSNPSVSLGGTVYIFAERSGGGGNLIAIHADTGDQLWDAFIPNSDEAASPLIGLEGDVYIAGWGNELYRFEGDGTGGDDSAWPMAGGNPGRTRSLNWNPASPPAALQSVTATQTFTDKIVLNWDSVPQSAYYEIWRSEIDDLNTATLVEHPAILGNIYTDRAVVPGQTYYYWIRGVNPAGDGSYSEPVVGQRIVATVEGELIGEYLFEIDNRSPFLIDNEGSIRFLTLDGKMIGLSQELIPQFSPQLFPRYEARMALISLLNEFDDYIIGFDTSDTSLSEPEFESKLQIYDKEGNMLSSTELVGFFSGAIAVATDGSIYVSTVVDEFLDDEETPFLHKLDSLGNIVWTREFEGFSIRNIEINSSGLIVTSQRDGNYLTWMTAEGERLGAVDTGFESGSYIGTSDGALVGYYGNGDLSCVNLDGTIRWTDSQVPGTFYLRGNNTLVYLPNNWGDPITEYDLKSGLVLFTRELPQIPVLGEFDWLGSQGILTPYDQGLALWNSSNQILEETNLVPRPNNRFSYRILPNGNLLVTENTLKLFNLSVTPAPETTSIWDHKNQNRSGGSTIMIPNPPALLTVDSTESQRYLRLDWGADTNAQFYEIWRSETDDAGQAELIADKVFGQRFYKDYSAVALTEYYYWLKAKNHLGTSDFSNEASGVREEFVEGSVLETYALLGEPTASPVIDQEGNIFLTVRGLQSPFSSDGGLLSLDSLGNERWLFQSDFAFSEASVSDNGTAYFEDRSGMLYAIGSDGIAEWELQTSDRTIAFGSEYPAGPPALDSDGSLLFIDDQGSETSRLLRINGAGEILKVTTAFTALIDTPVIGPSGSIYTSSLFGEIAAFSDELELLWKVDYNEAGLEVFGLASLEFNETTWVYDSRGSGLFNVFANGTVENVVELPWSGRESPLLGDDNSTIVIAFYDKIQRYLPSGDFLYEVVLGGGVMDTQRLESGMIFVADRSSGVKGITSEGTIAWETDLGREIIAAAAINKDGIAFVPTDGRTLTAVYVGKPDTTAIWPQKHQNARHTSRLDGDPIAPETPPQLYSQTIRYHDRIEISWENQPGVRYYRIWKGFTDDFSNAYPVADRVTGATSWSDELVSVGIPYYYWVEAIGIDGVTRRSGSEQFVRRPVQSGDIVRESSLPYTFGNYRNYVMAGTSKGNLIINRKSREENLLRWLNSDLEEIGGTIFPGAVASDILVDLDDRAVVLVRSDSGDSSLALYAAGLHDTPEHLADLPGDYFTATPAMFPDGSLVLQARSTGGLRRTFFTYSRSSGLQTIYEDEYGNSSGVLALLPDSQIVFTEGNEGAGLVDRTGNVRWHESYEGVRFDGPNVRVVPEGFLVASRGSTTSLVDLATGRLSYRISSPGSLLLSFLGTDTAGRAWVAKRDRLFMGEITGEPERSIDLGGVDITTLPIATTEGEMILGRSDSSVGAYGPDLKERWVAGFEEMGPIHELLSLPDGSIIVKGEFRIARIANSSAAAPRLWQGAKGNLQGQRLIPRSIYADLSADAADDHWYLKSEVRGTSIKGQIESVTYYQNDLKILDQDIPPFQIEIEIEPRGKHLVEFELSFSDPNEIIRTRRGVEFADNDLVVNVTGGDLIVSGTLNPDFQEQLWWSVDLENWYLFSNLELDSELRFELVDAGWADAQSTVFYRKTRRPSVPVIDWSE